MTASEVAAEIERRGIPARYHELYARAKRGGSRKTAIQAMCLECQGWEDGVIKAIRECPSAGCPLHAVRPYQGKGEENLPGEPSVDFLEDEEGIVSEALRESAD